MMSQNENKLVVFSALEVAKLCGVVNQTAINWIKSNHLKAFKTPGGQFRVYPKDLIDFMRSREIELPGELLKFCETEEVSKKLLIVDDDKALNTVLAKFMQNSIENLLVYQAFDGFEAGELMTEELPQILILDLDLPGVDGFALCKKINEGDKFGNPVIIVVTALEDESVEEQVKSLGVENFMKKPLDLPKIAEIVRSAFKDEN